MVSYIPAYRTRPSRKDQELFVILFGRFKALAGLYLQEPFLWPSSCHALHPGPVSMKGETRRALFYRVGATSAPLDFHQARKQLSEASQPSRTEKSLMFITSPRQEHDLDEPSQRQQLPRGLSAFRRFRAGPLLTCRHDCCSTWDGHKLLRAAMFVCLGRDKP